MVICVIGGAGYIGSHTVKQLNKKGYQTLVLDNLELGHIEAVKWGEFVQGDYTDRTVLDEVFTRYPIDCVMHFAAYASVAESMTDPAKFYRLNVVGGYTLLEAMRAHGVNKIIFSSSAATYGEPVTLPIPENHPQDPTNAYGESKLTFEKMLKWYDVAYGVKSVSLRYFNAAGADVEGELGEDHDPETHLIPLVIDAVMGKRANVKIFGTDYPTPDGTCIRDYVHVTDLADAHMLAYERLTSGEGTTRYNLGNGAGISVREIIDTVAQVSGKEVPVVEAERRAGDPARLVASSAKAQSELGWVPQYGDIRSIVESAYHWRMAHPNGFDKA
ncbi:MAG: UDP-glucose 4-epimerase GalE [Armatimonadota bacterium]